MRMVRFVVDLAHEAMWAMDEIASQGSPAEKDLASKGFSAMTRQMDSSADLVHQAMQAMAGIAKDDEAVKADHASQVRNS